MIEYYDVALKIEELTSELKKLIRFIETEIDAYEGEREKNDHYVTNGIMLGGKSEVSVRLRVRDDLYAEIRYMWRSNDPNRRSHYRTPLKLKKMSAKGSLAIESYLNKSTIKSCTGKRRWEQSLLEDFEQNIAVPWRGLYASIYKYRNSLRKVLSAMKDPNQEIE